MHTELGCQLINMPPDAGVFCFMAARCLACAVHDSNPLRVYGVARAMAVCEADNEVSRLKEEVQLLPEEMQAHVAYYRKLISRLQQLQDVLSDAAASAQQLRDAGWCQLGGTGRYQPDIESILASTAVRSGALTFVRLAHAEVQQHLAVAIGVFANGGIAAASAAAEDSRHADDIVDSEDGDAPPPS